MKGDVPPTQAANVTGQIPPLSSARWIPPLMVCAQSFAALSHHEDGERRKKHGYLE